LTKEIANASVEQSSGIGQVGQAVQQMDQITQQIAANAEEAAAAGEELSAQAQNTKDQVVILSAMVGGSVNGEAHTYVKAPAPVQTRQIPHKQDVRPTAGVKGNGDGDGVKAIQHTLPEPEALIPMGDNRITEHDEKQNDF
jgi:hypothetical protein